MMTTARSIPAVSVVIPLYNKALYVRRAIQSVLRQTVGDFELIVVDDGSTDAGAGVVEAIRDPRIRLIRQANAGVSAARNRGVGEARSDLVAFLDADDEWQEDFLETVTSLQKKFPDAVVCGTGYETRRDHGEARPEDCTATSADEAGAEGLIDMFVPRSALPMNASTMMVRRESLAKAGAFREDLALGEVAEFLQRMAMEHPVAWIAQKKAICHLEGDDHAWGSGRFELVGTPPLLGTVRRYVSEGGGDRIPNYLLAIVAGQAQQYMVNNVGAGDRRTAMGILDDCKTLGILRHSIAYWTLLVRAPKFMSLSIWKLWRLTHGRSTATPVFRSNRRLPRKK